MICPKSMVLTDPWFLFCTCIMCCLWGACCVQPVRLKCVIFVVSSSYLRRIFVVSSSYLRRIFVVPSPYLRRIFVLTGLPNISPHWIRGASLFPFSIYVFTTRVHIKDENFWTRHFPSQLDPLLFFFTQQIDFGAAGPFCTFVDICCYVKNVFCLQNSDVGEMDLLDDHLHELN